MNSRHRLRWGDRDAPWGKKAGDADQLFDEQHGQEFGLYPRSARAFIAFGNMACRKQRLQPLEGQLSGKGLARCRMTLRSVSSPSPLEPYWRFSRIRLAQ